MPKAAIMRERFIENYLTSKTATEAARISGYKHPNQMAWQLLNNPAIKQKIEEKKQNTFTKAEDEAKQWGLSVKETLLMLEDLAYNAKKEEVRAKCLELFMKKHALLTDKIISMEKAFIEVQSVLKEENI